MKKRMFQVLAVLFAFIFLLSAAAVPASAAAVKNTSTHLRTSYNSDNYIDYRITGTELAVAGKLDIRNLEKIGVLCADENKLTGVRCVGEEQARADVYGHTEQAVRALDRFGNKAEFLQSLAIWMRDRVK